MRSKALITLGIILTLVGCNPSKKGQDKPTRAGNKKVAVILEELTTQENKRPTHLSFKVSSTMMDGDQSTSFKTAVRMTVDSAIWMSISAYGYEVIRVLALPDSLSYLSKRDKKYYTGDYSFIGRKLGVPLNYYDLQALFLARSFGLDQPEQVNQLRSREKYVLTTTKNMEGMLAAGPDSNAMAGVEIAFTNWIHPETFQVERINILDVGTQNSASIQYLSFENIMEFQLLTAFKMDIIAGKKVAVESKISKYQVNQPLKFPFKISSKYERID